MERGETQISRHWLAEWWQSTFLDLAKEMRWSYLPPLMVYFAAGVSGLTSVVGAFFLKEYLDLSASFVAGLAFWAGLPWILKMPMGHVVDLFWRWKALLILLGAALITGSLLIMYALVTEPGQMGAIMPISSWYVVALLLAPSGYSVQDVVADAMTVEAVPQTDENGKPFSQEEARALHTTMQTLGRVAIISGLASVAGVNIWIFSGVEDIGFEARSGTLRTCLSHRACHSGPLCQRCCTCILSFSVEGAGTAMRTRDRYQATEVNWSILGGGLAFVLFSILHGNRTVFVCAGSCVRGVTCDHIFYLMAQLMKRTVALSRRACSTGHGCNHFRFPRGAIARGRMDLVPDRRARLFDEQFLAILAFMSRRCLRSSGLSCCVRLMASQSIAQVVVLAHTGCWSAVATESRALLWGCTNGPQRTYGRCGGRTLYRNSRHSHRVASGSGSHGANAGLDRPKCTISN